jgi:hypothetical protein
MFSRTTVSLALVAMLLVASERSASSACVLVSAPGQKACAPAACCANKSCCHTSQKRTGEPAEPLATAGSNQQNLVALAPLISKTSVDQLRAKEIPMFSIADNFRHSPETLALLCIRLI